jgi:type I restriction enzyme, S subunit
MRKDWEIKKLEDVVTFTRGLTYSKKDEVELSENIVLRSNNVDLKTNQLDFTELKYINSNIAIHFEKKVKEGTLLICTANGSKQHLGKVALIDNNCNYAFGGFMGLISPLDNIYPKFLFYLMISDAYKKFINSLSNGANINNLKFSDLGLFQIPIPPLPEQKRIVSILDKAFAAIDKAKANAEQNLNNAKELFESYLQNIFESEKEGYKKTTLSQIINEMMTGPFGSMLHKSDYVENHY